MTNQPQQPRPHSRQRWIRNASLSVVLATSTAALIGQGALASPGDPDADQPTTTTTSTTVPAPTTTTTAPAPAPAPTPTTPTTTTTAPPAEPAPTTTTTTTTAPPAAPAAQHVTVYDGQLGQILATIRYMESRGQYHLPPNKGNASGAYQFIASTWGNYGGYAHAYLAPPGVQDERAAADVQRFLDRYDNDVSMIPVLWYYPKAATNPELMDVVPVPSAGNVLTIREYQMRWLGVFATMSGEPVPDFGDHILSRSMQSLGLAPEVPERDDDLASIAYPVLGPSRIASPDCDAEEAPDTDTDTDTDADADADTDADTELSDHEAAGLCTQNAPSIVFGVKLQPVLAGHDGIVTAVDDEPASGRPISVTITDITGRSYIYSGFNDDNPGTSDGQAPPHLRLTALAEVGNTVRAGQIIGFMGDTDPIPVGVRGEVPTDDTVYLDPDEVAPHIRLSIVDLDGTHVDAYGAVVDSLFRSGCNNGIGRWSVSAQSDSFDEVVIETTDDDNDIDSEWIITSSGQVQAAGWAALINPNESCDWVPEQHYGPGAAGFDNVPDHWADPIALPTDVWLQVALTGDENSAAPLLRF